VSRRFETFVEMEVDNGRETTRVHLAYDTRFRLQDPLDSDLKVQLNDFEDLSADKLLAFYPRTEPRDAVDIFYILSRKVLKEIATAAHQKDPGFDLYWLAVALEKTRTFPDEIEKWPVEMLVKMDVREVKKRFLDLACQIMNEIKAKNLQ